MRASGHAAMRTCGPGAGEGRGERGILTYTLAIVVEEGLEFYDVGMSDYAHDLEFTILS